MEIYTVLHHSDVLATIRTQLADHTFGYKVQINSDNRVPSPWRELGSSRTTMRAAIANSGDLYKLVVRF